MLNDECGTFLDSAEKSKIRGSDAPTRWLKKV